MKRGEESKMSWIPYQIKITTTGPGTHKGQIFGGGGGKKIEVLDVSVRPADAQYVINFLQSGKKEMSKRIHDRDIGVMSINLTTEEVQSIRDALLNAKGAYDTLSTVGSHALPGLERCKDKCDQALDIVSKGDKDVVPEE